jgi:hypothetical protein
MARVNKKKQATVPYEFIQEVNKMSKDGEALSPSNSPVSEVHQDESASDLFTPDHKPIIETAESKISSVIDIPKLVNEVAGIF